MKEEEERRRQVTAFEQKIGHRDHRSNVFMSDLTVVRSNAKALTLDQVSAGLSKADLEYDKTQGSSSINQ